VPVKLDKKASVLRSLLHLSKVPGEQQNIAADASVSKHSIRLLFYHYIGPLKAHYPRI